MAFSFGNKTPQAFGAQPSGSITFGTPVAQSTGQFGLGTSTLSQTPSGGFQLHAATPQTNLLGSTAPTLNFNVTSTAAGQPLGFGAPACTASTGLSFGATTSAPPTGLAFGTPASAPSTGLTFGATPAATTSTGLTFGAPATTATGFGLGTPATTAGLTFGTQTTQSTGLFGSTPSTGLSFGAPASSATTTPSFGLGLGTTTTTASGLAFGATPTTTSTGLGFGLGASTGLFGLGGTPAKTSTVTTTVNVTPQNVGLGGITTQQKEPTTTKTELIPKDQPLPNELLQTVENFKNFVKEQKACSSEVSRCSVKDFRSVESEINNINKLLKEVEIELQRNRSIAQKLKFDTAKGLQSADIAQRTFNTPPGLQYNNVAPLNFFLDLADGFEKKIQEMKMQIENMSCYVRNLNRVGNVGSQDLALGMRRLHETFVALAGRLQSLHSQVELQKEEYLRFRKNILHDTTNVFEMPNSHNEALNIAINSLRYSPPMLASGPTPFNNVTATSFALLENQNQPSAYPGSTLSGNLIATSSTTTQGATTPFVAINTGLSSGSGFQLQNPPIGGKRGRP